LDGNASPFALSSNIWSLLRLVDGVQLSIFTDVLDILPPEISASMIFAADYRVLIEKRPCKLALYTSMS